MPIKQIIPHVYQITLPNVNCFLLRDAGNTNSLTLIDTGSPNTEQKIFDAIAEAGFKPSDLTRIVLTHHHPDHAGSAAAIAAQLNIPIWAYESEAADLERGLFGRLPLTVAPGLFSKILYRLFIKSQRFEGYPPVHIARRLRDGEVLPILGGVEVIHTPGHSAGHIALLLQPERLLIAGDACMNMMGLGYSIIYEDLAVGRASLQRLATYPFDKAVFGHGNALMKDAAKQLEQKFG